MSVCVRACVMGGEPGWIPPPVTPSPQELRERVLRGKYRVPFYMSTDCESILRRFLVLNPAKRCTLEVSPQPHSPESSAFWPFSLPLLGPPAQDPLLEGGGAGSPEKAPRPVLTPPSTDSPTPHHASN